MASGHVSRIQRPNTWLHRPTGNVKKALANSEPSTHGTKRTTAVMAPMSVFGGKADILETAPELRVAGVAPVLPYRQRERSPAEKAA